MTYQQLQNRILWRTRSIGTNFSFTGAPTNATTDFVSPGNIGILINEGYGVFVERTVDSQICTLICQFLTANANTNAATQVNLQPIPPQSGALGNLVNPAALKVYEFTYLQQNAGNPGISGQIERYIPLVSSTRFRRLAGAYTRRVGNFSSYPQQASQQFGEGTLQILPGFGVNGDTAQLTVAPDIVNSPGSCPASNGGQLSNASDVPLLPTFYHPAIVEYAVAEIFRAANNSPQAQEAENRFNWFVEKALEFGSARGEGDPEQVVYDWYAADVYDPSMLTS